MMVYDELEKKIEGLVDPRYQLEVSPEKDVLMHIFISGERKNIGKLRVVGDELVFTRRVRKSKGHLVEKYGKPEGSWGINAYLMEALMAAGAKIVVEELDDKMRYSMLTVDVLKYGIIDVLSGDYEKQMFIPIKKMMVEPL